MSSTHYYVTGPCLLDHMYGIAVIDYKDCHNTVTMPFLKSRMLAEHLTMLLNAQQLPISAFCKAYAEGRLMEALDEVRFS